MGKRLFWEVLIAGGLAGGWLALSGSLLGQGLDKETRLAVRRCEEPIETFVRKAYAAKDDLSLQEAIQALAHAPGVSFGCVVDQDEKVLAHSRISQLGKPYRPPRASQDLFSFPLRTEKGRWGTLIFSMTMQSRRALWRELLMAQAIAALFCLLAFLGWALAQERRAGQSRAAMSERDALLVEEKAALSRLEKRLQSTQDMMRSWTQGAVHKVPGALLLLDPQQRVAAANLAAAVCLGAASEISLLGKSWQEIPFLQSSGPALEQSLAHPSIPIEWSDPETAMQFTFKTIPGPSGTWVSGFVSNKLLRLHIRPDIV